MNRKLWMAQQLLLLVSGGVAVSIASLILLAPMSFYAANDIDIGVSASLLNELKAPAGLLMIAGVFMIMAIFRGKLAGIAVAVSATIYLSYAAARFASMAQDGLPSAGLLQAAIFEGTLGLACIAVLLLRRDAIVKVLS